MKILVAEDDVGTAQKALLTIGIKGIQTGSDDYMVKPFTR